MEGSAKRRKTVKWKKAVKRWTAGILAVLLVIPALPGPSPARASEIWPQKSTAPFYCLDGGKGWKSTDRYEIYRYDTLPSPLTEVQARRLFWAYPSNWNALKEAAAGRDPELYARIAPVSSGPNIVKRIKDDRNTAFAWVADNPEIEQRAIAVLEQAAAESMAAGKEAPEAIRDATSEERAVSFTVPPFSAGPGALDTEFVLGKEFIRDIAAIEAQSVWDNGSGGGSEGWLDASQDRNIAKSVLGENLYELTWSGDSIRIHNNGSVTANENAVGSTMSEEEKYNKTMVRYKITMRKDSGWYTEGQWSSDYLKEWMDFKACVNAPGQQRLYKADLRIVPSDQVFYLVIGQEGSGEAPSLPEYGTEAPELEFRVFRHEETFRADYNVKMKKLDDETGMPLKGSQFYLYERFEDEGKLSETEEDGGLLAENLNFRPWDGFRVFAEGTTDENGDLFHTDTRTYTYSKTYCDGHGSPSWACVPDEGEADDSGGEPEDGEAGDGDSESGGDAAEEAKDQNRRAAEKWLELYYACKEEADCGEGSHFHWLGDQTTLDEVLEVAESGMPGDSEGGSSADSRTAFECSGCRKDCEETYDRFRNLRFTYTWKEIQARTGYIRHDVHEDDIPVEFVMTVSSEAGAGSEILSGSSRDITETIWFDGNRKAESGLFMKSGESFGVRDETGRRFISDWLTDRITDSDAEMNGTDTIWSFKKKVLLLHAKEERRSGREESGKSEPETASDAKESEPETPSNASYTVRFRSETAPGAKSGDDSDWDSEGGTEDFRSYLEAAEEDGIRHLETGPDGLFSYPESTTGRDFWIIRDHRTEGKIHINKRDMDLYKGESDEYSSFGDTEGDGTLAGALYGLFAAEDLIHPDSDLAADGSVTNTGIVYRKHDLTAVAETDENGDAVFSAYTAAPGSTWNYETGRVEPCADMDWTGPANRYEENREQYGNWWIGRPLILGEYYVKELSRSEGYECSVNGKNDKWTGYGAGFETPDEGALYGTAVLSVQEPAASMEGEDESGTGYDLLPFTVTSTGTGDTESENGGYRILISGFPENTEFYRVDTGEENVTGPHVTGSEEVPVRDGDGNILWKTAVSDSSDLLYAPEYDETGAITGQSPVSRLEPQIQRTEQVPEAVNMKLDRLETDFTDPFWKETVMDSNLEDESGAAFGYLKAELEIVLAQNGYEVPLTAGGVSSRPDAPVYSRGVRKGDTDLYGITTEPGQPAVKTVYGAAVRKIHLEDLDPETTMFELFGAILGWYRENPQWSFGGLHEAEMTENGLDVTLYAGASVKGSRRFFTMKRENGRLTPNRVYAVVENPVDLRWTFQEYGTDGAFQFVTDRQYSMGSGADKRYYLDVTLIPAVAVDADGKLQPLWHRVMAYHQAGEEVIDYLAGDPEYGYRVPLTETVDKIEITTQAETVEKDVRLTGVTFDEKTGVHTIRVNPSGTDSFENRFSDNEGSLTLSFMAKLPEKKKELTEADISLPGFGNNSGFQAGETVGYADYLIRSGKGAVCVTVGGGKDPSDTFIVWKRLFYRGQNQVTEDGDTERLPVQVLERAIRQKIKVLKETEDRKAVGNFRFKIYLKANLERLFCDEQGLIRWIDRTGETVDIKQYREVFPELVQKLYTEKTDRQILEKKTETVMDSSGNLTETEVWNYEKFFQAIHTANVDKWHREGLPVWNTSWKPFAKNRITGILNEINTSEAAKENAKRSDAVRQFAVTWYLEEEIEKRTKEMERTGERTAKDGSVVYPDELYDYALYDAILRAEDYLAPFFLYDLDAIYEISWDSEEDGGIDKDRSTLSADRIADEENGTVYGVSEYLPYGDYVISEQQPYCAEWLDFRNKHYRIDVPQEISLPFCTDKNGQVMPHERVPWTMTEPGQKEEMSGYFEVTARNRIYKAVLRVEKLDAETGEPILHEDAIFGLYRAERDEREDGDGVVKRYEADTMISGSRLFLEAMGAENITSFARGGTGTSDGSMFSGIVPAGTPVCKETDGLIFRNGKGQISGRFLGLTTTFDEKEPAVFQTTGYLETPEEVEAGVYVLVEWKAPPGYVRSRPIPVEIYSDVIRYYPDGAEEPKAAVLFGEADSDAAEAGESETARIYVENRPVSLEISKRKTTDSQRSMKLSGRVEGTITELKETYGLENLELARNSAGTYLGFGWKKGTLEYLDSRKAAGERVEAVYENGVFQGYGYVTKQLKTADDGNRYVSGAEMALYEAIEIRPTGDQEDYRFEGVDVRRDRTGTVTDITVREGFAGEKTELICTEDGVWAAGTVKRGDTPVLFFNLDNLKVTERDNSGTLYGYDRSGERIKITSDTDSVYAIRNGRVEFELSGGDFSRLVYDCTDKAFTEMDPNTVLYHLGSDLSRDAQVDGYTGLAYVERSGTDSLGREEPHYYVWPVTLLKSQDGTVIRREKILTGRPEERNPGTSTAYITGTWENTSGVLEKKLNPVYDRYGLVRYYQQGNSAYEKGSEVSDRDGEMVTFRYDDLLESWNRAAYRILDHELLFSPDWEEDEKEKTALVHRLGESEIIPNVWKSGESAEILRRIVPGTYILEERKAPEGYARSLPVAVPVEETGRIQRISMTDETIKAEIGKTDGTEDYRKPIWEDGMSASQWNTEGTGAYTGTLIPGIRLALYKAKRVYHSDYKTDPAGYYLEREDQEPIIWTTGETPEYFETIAAGDYILEELDAPAGYLLSSMELCVKPVPELQSFIMKNDHTKLEIIKYETDERGERKPLSPENAAELTLYPVISDEDGNARMEDGKYIYRREAPVDSWKTCDLSEFAYAVSGAYEAMYAEYGTEFQKFAWKDPYDPDGRVMTAVLTERHVTGNGEIETQIWVMQDGSAIRVTAVRTGGDPVFEYQYHYRTGMSEDAPDMISYDTGTGIHRLDRIPDGQYVLVETETPKGYETAAPRLITVGKTGAVQRYFMENRKKPEQETGKIVIYKQDAAEGKKKLKGAGFEAENLQNGKAYEAVTDAQGIAVFENLPVKGPNSDGTIVKYRYRIREITAPEGYQLTPETWVVSFDGLKHGEEEDETDPTQPEVTLVAEDRETVFSFSKSDFHTDHFVPGAELAIFRAKQEGSFFVPDGEAIESWVSEDSAHEVIGKLSCGETYLLVEISVPAGYSAAPPVRFTISEDGSAITEISQNLSRIRILCREDNKGIAAVCVAGREAVKMRTTRTSAEGLIFAEEILEFSDGSGYPVLSETFREAKDSGYQKKRTARNPIATEYVLKNADGVRIDRWRTGYGQTEHSVLNERSEPGQEVFSPGQSYELEEQVLLSDGTWLVTGKLRFRFDENGNAEAVSLLNRKTNLQLMKTDLVSGEEIPGAELTLMTAEGEIVDRWISDGKAHVTEGAVIAGKTYILVEKSAPDGYETTEEIRITVSDDGRIDRVVMEDRKKEEPDTPKEPEKPKPPKEPEEQDSPETPEKPKPPVPDIPKKKYGKITVHYENSIENVEFVYLDGPRILELNGIPKTGDTSSPGFLLTGMCVSLALICVILRKRRKKCEEK